MHSERLIKIMWRKYWFAIPFSYAHTSQRLLRVRASVHEDVRHGTLDRPHSGLIDRLTLFPANPELIP